MKKATIEIKERIPCSTPNHPYWWVLYDGEKRIAAEFGHHKTTGTAKRAALRAKRLMADAEIEEEK